MNKKTVAEIYGRDPKGLEPEEVYSDKNYNQLCQEFDKMKTERDELLKFKMACDEAEPVATVVVAPGYWNRGHYYEGSKPYITFTELLKLSIGTKLFLHPAPVIASEQKPVDVVPPAWTNLIEYVLQDDLHNRLTPRVVDIAYTAFMLAKQPNSEDGGNSDWFNDTKPSVMEAIAKLRKDLVEFTRPPNTADIEQRTAKACARVAADMGLSGVEGYNCAENILLKWREYL